MEFFRGVECRLDKRVGVNIGSEQGVKHDTKQVRKGLLKAYINMAHLVLIQLFYLRNFSVPQTKMSLRVFIRAGGEINLISETAITKTIMAGDLTNRKFLDYEKERAKNRTLGDTLTGVSCFSVEMK